MAKPIRKILMVDDSPEDKAIFRRYLNKDENYEYLIAGTDKPEEVIDLCNIEKPDCVLLDYNLPKKNGIEVIRELVDEFGENNIPIVMLSGSSVIETAVEALRLGAHDFLIKGSVTPVELRLKVDNAIEKVELWRQKNRTEEELRESEERMSLAFEAAELGLWDWDIINNSAVWRGNQSSLFGQDNDEFTHNFGEFLKFIHPDDRDEFEEYIEEVLKDEKEYYSEFRVVYPNGDIRWLVAKGKIFRDEEAGKPKRLMGINYDITRRKDLEFEREEILLREKILRREAEAANNAKDEFLAVLSHELRSPLNSMLGWARMLRSGKLDENKAKHAVAVIEDNIKLQNSLIEDILDVSRIIGGKMNLALFEVDFALIVNSAVETVRPAADAKNIEIKINIKEFESKISADSARLQQVVGNLLTNAIKFTDDGGEICVTLKKVGRFAKLDVTDNGIGIKKENIKNIFNRFEQVDSSTKRNYSGLGLGLAIVKSLVEMHNGKVSAVSEGIDSGATFTVELPLSVEPKKSKIKSAKIKKTSKQNISDDKKLLEGLEIFIVDDEVYSLELIEYVLENEGAEVHSFQNAYDALEKLEEIIPDLLISDIGMSKMDGLEFIREVRKKFDENILPAIALTAFASLDDHEKSIAAGFQLHFPKPIDIEDLPISIKELINEKSI